MRKHCNKCKQEFELTEMAPPKMTYCRACQRIISKANYYKYKKIKKFYLRDLERRRERYSKMTLLQRMRIRTNNNAKRSGTLGTLSLNDCQDILDRDKTCVYCGSSSVLTFDHIRPKQIGGSNSKNNIVLACYNCNIKRGPADAMDWSRHVFDKIPPIVAELHSINYKDRAP
jgi:5-methylcytosine-specific restriction endonuclease McrA